MSELPASERRDLLFGQRYRAPGGYGASQPTPRVKRHMEKKNSVTDRLVDLAGRLTSITMHQSTDLIELDPIELQTKSISNPGPANGRPKTKKMGLGVTVRRRAARGAGDLRSSNGVISMNAEHSLKVSP